MNNPEILHVFDMIGPLCVAADDGQIVHDEVARHLQAGKHVVLSFDNVTTLISAFLNAAIGQLYGEFTEEEIKNGLSVDKLSQEDLILLKRVVDNAKLYFLNRKEFDAAWKEEADDEE